MNKTYEQLADVYCFAHKVDDRDTRDKIARILRTLSVRPYEKKYILVPPGSVVREIYMSEPQHQAIRKLMVDLWMNATHEQFQKDFKTLPKSFTVDLLHSLVDKPGIVSQELM